jgi:Uma2 family endonuclease
MLRAQLMSTPYLHFDTEIHYPDSDGQPMAESDFQRKVLIYAVEALSIYFQDRDDVYVSGNMFIYYEEGNPKAVVAPDVFVVFGADKHDRFSYRLWQEPKAPDFVLEITSRSTRSEDQGAKRGIYAFLGIQEYWQFDPTHDYLTPPLQGLRLEGENYQPLSPTGASGGLVSLHSDVLGLDLRCDRRTLHFYDPATGYTLLTHQEAEQARHEAEKRITELEARLRALEAEHDPDKPEKAGK